MRSTPLTLDEYNFTKTWRARFHFRNLRFGGFTLEHGRLHSDPDLPLTYPPIPPSTLPRVLPLMCMRAGVPGCSLSLPQTLLGPRAELLGRDTTALLGPTVVGPSCALQDVRTLHANPPPVVKIKKCLHGAQLLQ